VNAREIVLVGVPARCLLRQADGSVGFFAMRPNMLKTEVKQAMAQKVSNEAVFQVGTRVKHPTHGAGVVAELMEDGRTRIVFDEGEEHRYRPASMHKLQAELREVGTRVVHPKHGTGVVAEIMGDGRTRVVFDDGEEHRYKSSSMHNLSAKSQRGAKTRPRAGTTATRADSLNESVALEREEARLNSLLDRLGAS
jgi:uncharacterized protein (UPF0216 family)